MTASIPRLTLREGEDGVERLSYLFTVEVSEPMAWLGIDQGSRVGTQRSSQIEVDTNLLGVAGRALWAARQTAKIHVCAHAPRASACAPVRVEGEFIVTAAEPFVSSRYDHEQFSKFTLLSVHDVQMIWPKPTFEEWWPAAYRVEVRVDAAGWPSIVRVLEGDRQVTRAWPRFDAWGPWRRLAECAGAIAADLHVEETKDPLSSASRLLELVVVAYRRSRDAGATKEDAS